MKTPRLLLALTLINLALSAFLVLQLRSARAVSTSSVLRGRALEIVDDRGRVRAAIRVFPAGPARRSDGSPSEPDGKIYPETVLLRLINEQGRPTVKIGASGEGAGLGLIAGSTTSGTYLQLTADLAGTSLRLRNEDGHERSLRP
jgi:hypothetical protein